MTNYNNDYLHFLSPINPPSGEITNTGEADSNTIINNYSIDPLGTIVNGDANVFTMSDGTIAVAVTDFLGLASSNPTLTLTSSNSEAFAEDGIYQALASFETTILASFSVDAYEEFSFDFTSTIDIATQISDPYSESAEAAAQSSFLLLDAHSGYLVDYFTVSGGVVTSSQDDFFLSGSSQYVDINTSFYDYDFWGNQESVEAIYQGSYERTFYHDQDLVLVQVSSSHVELTGDYLLGNLGHDVIYGTLGDDVIYDYDPTRDKIYASHGNDTVYGRDYDDIIEGGLGNDHLYGGNGDDSIGGGKGYDHLYGEYGDDYLVGGKGKDHLVGGSGDDDLHGGKGDDYLNGTDIYAGGYGEYDILTGGHGSDRFILGDHYGGYYNYQDWHDLAVITDFNKHEDVAQLHGDSYDYWLGNWDGHASYLYEYTHYGWDAVATFEGTALNNSDLHTAAFEFV